MLKHFRLIAFAFASSILIGCTHKSVTCTPNQADLGEIIQNQKRSFDFSLRNDTGDTVLIVKTSSTCGCTSVQTATEEIKPRCSDKVTATISPLTRVGPFKSFVTIVWRTTGSQTLHEIKLKLLYNAVRLISTEPKICTFPEIDADNPSRITFDILRGESKIAWNNLNVSSTKLELDCAKISNDRYTVNVSIPVGKFPLGLLKDDISVILLNNQSVVAQTTLPIQTTIIADVKALPATVYCGIVHRNDYKTGSFIIDATVKAQTLQFTSVVSSQPDFIKANCVAVTPGQVLFNYTVNTRDSPGAHSGYFLVTLKTPKTRNIRVPFIAYLQ